MLRKITTENFFSLREETLLDLTTGAKTPTDYSFMNSIYGDQVSILGGIFGPNASGKTNLLKSLSFLNFFLRNSYENLKPKQEIPVDTYFGNAKPIKFTLEFEGQSTVYRYDLEILKSRVVLERLKRYNKPTHSFRTVLLRKEGKQGAVITQQEDFTDKSLLTKLLKDRPNVSFLSAGLVTGRPEFIKLDQALGSFATNVGRLGKLDHQQGSMLNQLEECADFFHENPHFIENVSLRLQQADLGITKFEIKEVEIFNQEEGETNTAHLPFVTHNTAEGEFTASLLKESSGTQRLFTLLRMFLPVLTDGGMAVIDEMESDLHPHLIPLLLDLFVDKDSNPKRAQLIFTCHHVEILNHLAKEQIFLVEKDDVNQSQVRRLSDYKGVRRDENHFANYNSGRYDAIPEPEIF
jgi:AAA15 family ATPase/GTPase